MKQGKTKGKAIPALAALVAASFATLPAEAAAPRVFCLQTYGHEVPPANCEKNGDQLTAVDYSGKVYPNSLLYLSSLGSQGSFVTAPTGSIFIEGVATPGALLELTVTDGVKTLGPFTIEADDTATSSSEAGSFFAEIMVSELGSHRATPGADANNVGDDELGPTTLTVRAKPIVAGVAGPIATDAIVKHAASPLDAYKPRVAEREWPPIDMDHACSSRHAEDAVNGSQEAIFGFWLIGFERKTPCTWYSISGSILDHYNGTQGTASEISDVRIQITKEGRGETFLDVTHSQDSQHLPPGRAQILTRAASNISKYFYTFNINDLPPNDLALIGEDDFYTVTVTVCDAWGDVMNPNGNCDVASQGDIIVHAY